MTRVLCPPLDAGVYGRFTVANGPVPHHVGVMMKVTVRVDVERRVRDEAARQLAAQGLTIDHPVRIVLAQAAAGCAPDLGALVPNPITVAAIEAARRGEVVELGTPDRGDPRAQSGRLRAGAAGKAARAVGQAHGVVPERFQARKAGRAREPPGQDSA